MSFEKEPEILEFQGVSTVDETETGIEKETHRIQGIVLKRRSLGKNLAFATLLLKEEGSNIFNSSSNGNHVVQVKFHRKSPVWDKSQDESFPTKTSALPYSAIIECETVPIETTSTAGLTTLLVSSWRMLENPRDNAIEIAKLNNGKEDGLYCSFFLQKRGEAFNLSQNLLVPFQGTTSNKVSFRSSQRTSIVEKKGDINRNTCPDGQLKNEDDVDYWQKHKMPLTEVNRDSLVLCQTVESKMGRNYPLAHGDKRHKALRAKIFAKWILETFQHNLCRVKKGGVVLDVAGGKGNLSIELAVSANLSCIVMDPMVRKKFVSKRDLKRLVKTEGPIPKQVANSFYKEDFLPNSCDRKVQQMVQFSSCLLLVGLHPDECTEDIVDVALMNNLPMAVIPCCVYPSLFPNRYLRDTKGFVQSYDDFLEYLLEKDKRLQKAHLPFEGKNQVIYLNV